MACAAAPLGGGEAFGADLAVAPPEPTPVTVRVTRPELSPPPEPTSVTVSVLRAALPPPPEPIAVAVSVLRSALPPPEPAAVAVSVLRPSYPVPPEPTAIAVTVSRPAAEAGSEDVEYHECSGVWCDDVFCCPTGFACWDRLALRQAIREGRCR